MGVFSKVQALMGPENEIQNDKVLSLVPAITDEPGPSSAVTAVVTGNINIFLIQFKI